MLRADLRHQICFRAKVWAPKLERRPSAAVLCDLTLWDISRLSLLSPRCFSGWAVAYSVVCLTEQLIVLLRDHSVFSFPLTHARPPCYA